MTLHGVAHPWRELFALSRRHAWRKAGAALPAIEPGTRREAGWRGFLNALLLQLNNSKISVFFGSIFLLLLPGDVPGWMEAAVLVIVAFNEFAWFALLFSGGTARAFYRRTKRWLDWIMGGVLGLLGARLLAAEV